MFRRVEWGVVLLLLTGALGLVAVPTARAEKLKLKLKWSQEFSKSVEWYARTSAGVVVVRTGKSLVGLDEAEGSQLWILPEVESNGRGGGVDIWAQRGRNMVEVPGMGVLLLNRVKFPGDTEGRLVAINLLNGKKLWEQEQLDDLMTAVPLYKNGEMVLVTRRLEKKRFAEEIIAAAAVSTQVPLVGFFMTPYPYHFEFLRMDAGTGKTKWSSEYNRLFTPGTARVRATDEQVLLYFGNRLMGSLSLESGKLLWEDGEKSSGSVRYPLPAAWEKGKLIYSSEYLRAVDPGTQKESWSLEELGKVTGIVVRDGLAIALGENKMAAADIESGKERWRIKTHGHTSNLVWNKASDTLIYVDGKGLHMAEAETGKTVRDIPLRAESWPWQVRLASKDTAVTIAVGEVCAYNLKTGVKVASEGKLKTFFRADAHMDNWPMPEDGQELEGMTTLPSTKEEWDGLRKTSILDTATQKSLEEQTANGESLEGFETEKETQEMNGSQKSVSKIWWIDARTNEEVEITPAALHHDVDRRAGLVFAVNGHQIWSASIGGPEGNAAASASSK